MSSMSVKRRLAFGLFTTLLVLVCFENALKLSGFRYKRSLSYMQFNFPRPHTLHKIYVPDPDLLWVMRPNYEFGEGYPSLNAQGFRGPDFVKAKTPGTLRIACIGCSVTFGHTDATYPALLAERLSERLGRPVEGMNFGVPGYSSWQGAKLLARALTDYQPDLVVVLFGWNDHWLARGFADKDQIVNMPVGSALDPIKRYRIYELLNKGYDSIKAKGGELPEVMRVVPADYKNNLEAMIQMCKAKGTPILLATAPSGISVADPFPDFLVIKRFILANDELAGLHDQYNEVVRETANNLDVPLADLDSIFLNEGITTLFDDPAIDLIHPNIKGLQLMADSMALVVEQRIWKKSDATKTQGDK